MRWDTYEPEIRNHASLNPGGTDLADALVNALDIEPGFHVLDLCPGNGVITALMAKELGVEMTSIVSSAEGEAEAEASARILGVTDKVRVIPGAVDALPVPSEEFQRIFCLGNPFFFSVTADLARELHRVLCADGLVGYAGPASFRNDVPDYMRDALGEFPGASIKTPAYTGLLFSREGFHIINAEYLPGAWDHWTAWLDRIPPGSVSDTFRRAVIEDGGRWLSLALIVLRKPPRPHWAV